VREREREGEGERESERARVCVCAPGVGRDVGGRVARLAVLELHHHVPRDHLV